MMQDDASGTGSYLDLPGTKLYYEVSGEGPVLLLIPGGMVDADGFAQIVPYLEPHYSVVRYDPRGISRSMLENPEEEVSVEMHADDAAALLQAVSSEPAYVVGNSGGAVIGLALTARNPEQIKTFVAHEPPLVEMLPADDPRRAAGKEIYDIYLAEGPEAAMGAFMATSGMDESAAPSGMTPEQEAELGEYMMKVSQNLDFFFSNYMMPITSYQPDIAALQATPGQVVVGVGETSVGQEARDTALALADRLGAPAVEFPGDHVGMFTHPEEFTAKLNEVFGV